MELAAGLLLIAARLLLIAARLVVGALVLVGAYKLVEREWRHRVVMRAARRILPVGSASVGPPTRLDVGRAEAFLAGGRAYPAGHGDDGVGDV